MNWLLFLPQLPASPSTLRVMVWRRMRAAGALGLQNGVWLLPFTPAQEQFLERLLARIQSQAASGYIFGIDSLNQSLEDDILGRFRAERDEEYLEFCERCEALIAEIERESRQEKFTFAELEETEEDLKKLSKWWDKICTRDYFGGHRKDEAHNQLENCRTIYRIFANLVYVHSGVGRSTDLNPD